MRKRRNRIPGIFLSIVFIGLIVAAVLLFRGAGAISVALAADPADIAVLTGAGEYKKGDEVTVSAEVPNGWEFLYWSLDAEVVSDSPDYTFIVEERTSLKAHFTALDYSITASAQGQGSVSYSDEKAVHGDTVTVTAIAVAGFRFVSWLENGEVVSNKTQYSFIADGDRNLTATFVPEQYSLEIEVYGEGGTVAEAWTIEPKAAVTLTAIAQSGYEFFGWVDLDTLQEIESKSTLTLAWNGPRKLAARFRKELVHVDGSSLIAVVGKPTTIGRYEPDDLVYLPTTYSKASRRVRQEVADALERMYHDAKAEGVSIFVDSAYRSYDVQHDIFYRYVRDRGGVFNAETFSARPGQSEHQLGTAVDFGGTNVNYSAAFANTSSGKWLMANAHKYGFALSYPENSQEISGYIYEPWHYRYIGVDMAVEWKESGLVLIEFLKMKNQAN